MFTLHNGDCRPYMKAMQDKSVDVIVTDPPYGMNYLSNHYKGENPFQAIAGDDRYPSELIPEFQRIARKAVFAFCRWDNLSEVPPPTSFIVWVKNNWTAGDLNHAYGRMWEGVLFYPMDGHEFQNRPPDVFDSRRVPPTDLVHPTQKPVAFLKWLIEANTNPNEIVFDPFMGSGSTGVACIESSRQFIGCELSPEYFSTAEKRIKSAVLSPSLFTPSNPRLHLTGGTVPAQGDLFTPEDLPSEGKLPAPTPRR